MEMTLRVANLDDQSALNRLFERSYPTLLKDVYDAETLKMALPQMIRAQPALLSSGTFFVWDCDGTLAGAGGWSVDTTRADKAHIRHVATDPAHLRKGIAQALIMHCLTTAKAAGITEMECWSTRYAEGFYAALGFSAIGPIDAMLGGTVAFPSIRMTMFL